MHSASPVAAMPILADTEAVHEINAPLERIDLAQWLFSLTDREYQACSNAHIACGTTRTADGRRMSINVERISGNFLVQHYVEDLAEPHHVRVTSESDSYTGNAHTKLRVSWELAVRRISDFSCELSNRVQVWATPEFLALLQQTGVTDLSDVKSLMAQNTKDHNLAETPFFARDIERKAHSEKDWGRV